MTEKSRHWSVLEMVKSQIEHLGLPGLRSGEVEILQDWRGEDEPVNTRHGILIGWSKETYGNGNSEMWEINYPAVLAFGRGRSSRRDGDLQDYTLWRQKISDVFDHKREPQVMYLETDTEVVRDICRVQFDPGQLDDDWKKNFNVCAMVVWTTLFVRRFL